MWLLVASEAHVTCTFTQHSLRHCLHTVQYHNLAFQLLVDTDYYYLDTLVSSVGVSNMVWVSVRHPDALWDHPN